VRVDTIGNDDRAVTIEADAEERRCLSERFSLVAVDSLAACFALRRDGAAIVASGTVTAQVTQSCSATGEPLPARVEEAVTLRFVDDFASGNEEEVELSDDVLDTLPIESGAIDLGEAAAETMALALDPFPRAPGAERALRAAGVVGEGEAGPFAALAALKAKPKG
jgi:uncharacterized metal-binding protein YceD (DUF177 family)